MNEAAPPVRHEHPVLRRFAVELNVISLGIVQVGGFGHDVVGRGDRDLSVGEVRLRPAPRLGVTLRVAVRLWPDGPPLQGAIEVTERPV